MGYQKLPWEIYVLNT